MVKELTSEDFDDFIAKGVSVIDFWAEWCGPCKISGPHFEKAAGENNEAHFGKVNVDDNYDLASQYEVMSIPTFIFFKNGEMVDRHTGILSAPEIKKKIQEL